MRREKERWPTPSWLHFHFLFVFLSPSREDRGGVGIVSPLREPLGVTEHLPWPFGTGSPGTGQGVLLSSIGRTLLRRGSEPLDKPEGRRLLRRMGVNLAGPVRGAPDPLLRPISLSFPPFWLPLPLGLCLCFSLPAAAFFDVLLVLLTSGDTNRALQMTLKCISLANLW